MSMANPALGGILTGLMSGWERGDQKTRERTHDQRVTEEYDYSKGRRGVEDSQRDTMYGLGLEDRQRRINSEDKTEVRKDADWDWTQGEREHLKNRRPIEEAQTDEIRGLGIQQTKQQMRQSDARHSADMGSASRRAELERMGLDDAKIQQKATASRRALAAGFALMETTGSTESLRAGLNATLGKDQGYEVKSITAQSDGSYVIDFGGDKPMVLPNRQALEEAAFKLTEPDTYAQVMLSTMQQRNGIGTGGRQPSAQEALIDRFYRNLPDIPGETEQQREMRAIQYARSTANKSPDQIYAAMLQAQTSSDMRTQEIENAKRVARELTQSVVDFQNGSDGGAVFGGGGIPRHAPAAGPQGRAQGPTQAAPAAQDETPPEPGARKAPDGKWYVPDPQRPGKYLLVQ